MAGVSTIIRIWLTVIGVIFLAVIVLGSLACFFIASFRGVGLGIALFGFVGLAVSVAGCVGAGYEKEEDKKRQKKRFVSLVFFFGGTVVLHVIYIIFGVTLICLQSSVKMIRSLSTSDFQKVFDALPFHDDVDGTVGKLKNFMLGVGIFLIVFSLIMLIIAVVAAVRLGTQFFTKNFMASFSVVEVVLGLAVAGFLLFLNFSTEYAVFGNAIGRNVIIPVIVFGFLLAAVGFVGFLTTCLGNKFKCVSIVFNTFNIVVFVAFLVMFVLCIVLRGNIEDWARRVCSDGRKEEDYCYDLVVRTKNNLCSRAGEGGDGECSDCTVCGNCTDAACESFPVCTQCAVCVGCADYTIDTFIIDVRRMVEDWAFILLFVCLYLVLFLLFVIICTCINCFHKPEDEDAPPVKVHLMSAPQFLDFY